MVSKQNLAVAFFCFSLVMIAWVHVHSQHRPSKSTLMWIHGIAWILQFWGHGVHERRAPALLTNLSQALLMAPLFVVLVRFIKLVTLRRQASSNSKCYTLLINLFHLLFKLSIFVSKFGRAQEVFFFFGWAPELRKEIMDITRKNIERLGQQSQSKVK